MSEKTAIHPTALVDPKAELGNKVVIGPYSVVGPDVVIGDDCRISSHVVINGPTVIGRGNRIFQFASVGEECQDLKYRGEPTRLEIGDNNVIREYVSLHRGTVQDEGVTRVGSNNLLMACAHVAHDVVIGNNCILANYVGLAGHCKVDDHAILGGQAGFHQFVRVGAHCFVAGGSTILKDVPPYVMADSKGARSINLEGLKRRGFEPDALRAIRKAYKIIFRQGLTTEQAIAELEPLSQQYAEVQPMTDFLRTAGRGIVR